MIDSIIRPFYGEDREIVEPPNGEYSFIEWDDLDREQRFAMVIDRQTTTPRAYGHSSWEAILSTLEGFASRESAVGVLERLQATAAKQREEAAQKTGSVDISERVVAPGMEKFLVADPNEVIAIRKAVTEGRVGKLVECGPHPIPQWTCVWVDGKSARGVLPGSMSNAVTFGKPESYITGSVSGDKQTHYTQRVFLK